MADDRWKSRRFSKVTGRDGEIETEVRTYEIADDEALAWRLKTGDPHPDRADMTITKVDIDRHRLGLKALITVTYSTAGMAKGAAATGAYLYSVRSSTTRQRRRETFADQKTMELDLILPRMTLTVTGWEEKPQVFLLAVWPGLINLKTHLVGDYEFEKKTLLCIGGSATQVGVKRWRHKWMWLYNYAAWTTTRRSTGATIDLYGGTNFTPVIGKLPHRALEY